MAVQKPKVSKVPKEPKAKTRADKYDISLALNADFESVIDILFKKIKH